MKKLSLVLFLVLSMVTFFSCQQVNPVVDTKTVQFFSFDFDGDIAIANKYASNAKYGFSLPISFYGTNINAATHPELAVTATLKAVASDADVSLLDSSTPTIADRVLLNTKLAEGAKSIEIAEFEISEPASYVIVVLVKLSNGKEYKIKSNKFEVLKSNETLASSNMGASIAITIPDSVKKISSYLNADLGKAKIAVNLTETTVEALTAGIITNATLKTEKGAFVKSLLLNKTESNITGGTNNFEYEVELGSSAQSGNLVLEVEVATPNGKIQTQKSEIIAVKDLAIGKNFDQFYIEKTYGDDPEDSNYVVVFEDDFETAHKVEGYRNDGTKWVNDKAPDPAKWDLIGDFAGNGWIRHDFSVVEDGKLKIKAQKADWSLYGYPFKQGFLKGNLDMSGRIQSKEKFGFLYGRMTVDFVLPQGNTWPAIWFLANSERSWDEIDFIEYYPFKFRRRWYTVIHRNISGIGKLTNGITNLSTDISAKKLHSVMDWTEKQYRDEYNVDGNVSIKTQIGDSKDWEKVANINVNKQIVPMYPIIEIQRAVGCWIGGGEPYNSNEELIVENFRISQPKDKRYATMVDPLYNFDNIICSGGIRQGFFEPTNMSVDDISIGEFFYGGQPRYERSLLAVKPNSDGENYIIYKAKNLRGVNLTTYYPSEMGANISGEELFTIQGANSLADGTKWNDIDITLDSNKQTGNRRYFQLTFHKIQCEPNKYDYVKINFPSCEQKSKIYLGAVVLTRYEGTNYASHKAEWE